MSHLLGDEDPRHIQDCPACQNEQARCAGCRQSDYRPVIRENFEHQGIPYRSRVDIEDDKVTTHRRLEAEMAIKALSVLQVIRARQKGREEAQKRKQEAKAQSTEVERLRKQHVDALYRERLVFPEREEKPFDFADVTKTVWRNPPKDIQPDVDPLGSVAEEGETFKVTSSLYPTHVWTYHATSEFNARRQVARFLKISYSETQIVK